MTAAIYSQYGALFVALPAFLIAFVIALQTKCFKKILFMIALYVIDLIVFGIPLYYFFFYNKFMRITGNSDVRLAKLRLGDYFKHIGQVIGYFNNNYNKMFCLVSGIAFLLLTLILFIWARKEKHKKTIVLISLFTMCYLLHSTLVQLNYYSTSYQRGVACRYSLFYIPLLYIMLPVYFMELVSIMRSHRLQKGVYAIGLFVVICIIVYNFRNLNDNWKKSYDDVIARSWVEQEGYKTKTYLFGWPGIGCREFLNRYGYDFHTYIQAADSSINPESDFPDAFWIWRTGLTADTVVVDDIVEKFVEDKIYDCDMIVDYVCDGGNKAQLIYFHK